MQKGAFIVFEGLDGSGTSTQLKRIGEKLKKLHIPHEITYEPTDIFVGKLIRDVLKHKETISPEGLQLMFSADRAHHLETVILPNIKNEKIVICDRYSWSTIAFGSLSIETEWLKEINKYFPKPDLTFYFKVSSKICMKRIHKRGKKKELFEELQKLQKIEKVYDNLSKTEEHVIIIDANKSVDEIEKKIWENMEKYINAEF